MSLDPTLNVTFCFSLVYVKKIRSWVNIFTSMLELSFKVIGWKGGACTCWLKSHHAHCFCCVPFSSKYKPPHGSSTTLSCKDHKLIKHSNKNEIFTTLVQWKTEICNNTLSLKLLSVQKADISHFTLWFHCVFKWVYQTIKMTATQEDCSTKYTKIDYLRKYEISIW